MKLKLYSLLLLLSVVLFACKSASKLYQKGHYDEAVELAAKKLQKDPNDHKLIAVLQDAYRYAVEDHENRIRNYSKNNNDLKYEWMYNEYADLQRLYNSIRKSPSAFSAINPADYSSYLTTYAEKAGDAHYQRGLSLMNNNDKQSFKNAYYEFRSALNFIPNDLTITQKRDEAYNLAAVKIVVMPIEERSGYQYSSYRGRYTSFDDNMLRYLKNNNRNEFIRYYSEAEARSRNIIPDNIVDVRFSSINIGRSHEENSVRTVSKDVVVKEIVYKPDSVVKQYSKVYAKITTTRRSIRSEGMMQISVKDLNNRTAWAETYTGQHFWVTEFANFTGDARALAESDKELVNRQQQFPPREEDIIRSIVDEIQSKAQCGIQEYFVRY